MYLNLNVFESKLVSKPPTWSRYASGYVFFHIIHYVFYFYSPSTHGRPYWAHMYYTLYSWTPQVLSGHSSIMSILIHTYSNSYLPSFNTSYINAHPRATPADDLYVYTIVLVSIWAYLDDNSIFLTIRYMYVSQKCVRAPDPCQRDTVTSNGGRTCNKALYGST